MRGPRIVTPAAITTPPSATRRVIPTTGVPQLPPLPAATTHPSGEESRRITLTHMIDALPESVQPLDFPLVCPYTRTQCRDGRTTLKHERHTMSSTLLNISSNTVDRRKPRVVLVDGSGVPIGIVPEQ